MRINFYYHSAVKLGLTTISLLCLFQLNALAQTTVKPKANVQTTTISQLNYPPFELNSSPNQSRLPSTSERRLRLLERLKPPVTPTPANTVEQKIHLRLVLSERRLYVYQGNSIQVSYPVAIGKRNWETPTGEFQVRNMLENPAWENPFVPHKEIINPGLKNNPLGERWIGFWTDGRDEIGFHGTYQRNSVGQAISHGCVRMFNEDIRKLYEIVTIGTTVKVVP
ncbi:L,D-transpeptidase [Nodularia sphaerocarpa]|uniref:L,D-transpeptidase n=1 Tax=Nodularia sphaerocarpa TaxID=137816 RepID=UPI001EFA5D53|nr:L,D-transpeptidase [Nodularia sphaerocarpa]MDB9373894.1 L,D-transpeptidase [Nodularia sphaerocarpa CS-585]MDB9380590.1 L,D-transpeptidase [Nodularia sphaerocarpa CS-585A2]ULP72215.1 putative L,D-transpeptidase YnhG [Nodularia sphaerocarpa UHCC 0038]